MKPKEEVLLRLSFESYICQMTVLFYRNNAPFCCPQPKLKSCRKLPTI